MRAGTDRPIRPLNWFVAAIYGALVALVLAYALSYIVTRLGVGIVTGPEGATSEPALLSRAGLNLYASQHITLAGRGEVASALDSGAPLALSASLVLPISVWAILPVIALLVGGYSAAHTRPTTGRWGMLAPAIVSGVIYALVLTALSGAFQARIEGFLMPEIGGIQPNPPSVSFRPDPTTTLFFGGAFGIIFSCLGALLAVRERVRDAEPGRLWISTKAIVSVVLVLQMLVAIGLGVWLFSAADSEDAQEGEQARLIEMLPAAAGVAYTMAHGADLVALVESRLRTEDTARRTFQAKAELYRDIRVDQLGRKSRKSVPSWVSASVGAVVGLAMLLAGWLAVRWGARGGSVPVGLRVAAVHTVCLAFLAEMCSLKLVQGDPVAVSTVAVRPALGVWLLFSFAAVWVLAMIGAHIANYRSVRIP